MDSTVDIDATDDKILHSLLRDGDLNLKEIAKECGIGYVTVFKRIKRLKELGVITGSKTFARLDVYCFKIIAFIGIEAENNAPVDEILRFFAENLGLIEPSASIGKYDLHALIYAEDMNNLNDRVEKVKRLRGIRKVDTYVWSLVPKPEYDYLDLIPKKRKN
jgi:DNA-binding Lrp family transcriptional regulator